MCLMSLILLTIRSKSDWRHILAQKKLNILSLVFESQSNGPLVFALNKRNAKERQQSQEIEICHFILLTFML